MKFDVTIRGVTIAQLKVIEGVLSDVDIAGKTAGTADEPIKRREAKIDPDAIADAVEGSRKAKKEEPPKRRRAKEDDDDDDSKPVKRHAAAEDDDDEEDDPKPVRRRTKDADEDDDDDAPPRSKATKKAASDDEDDEDDEDEKPAKKKSPFPEALAEADNIRTVLVYLKKKEGITDADEMYQRAKALKDEGLPYFQTLKGNFETRVNGMIQIVLGG